jgi:hypothetical protein
MALHLVSAHGVQRLRRQPDVPDHRDFRLNHSFDQARSLFAAFNLYRFGASVLYEARGIAQRFALANVIRGERHVRDQECVLHPAAHGAGVVQHLLHGDGQCILVTQYDHAKRIADQDHVDASFVHQARAGVIVGGQAGDDFVTLFLFEKSGSSNLGAKVAGSDAHDVLQYSSPILGDTACNGLVTREYRTAWETVGFYTRPGGRQ